MGSSYRRTRATESADDQLVQLEEGFHPSNFAEMFIRLEIVTGLKQYTRSWMLPSARFSSLTLYLPVSKNLAGKCR